MKSKHSPSRPPANHRRIHTYETPASQITWNQHFRSFSELLILHDFISSIINTSKISQNPRIAIISKDFRSTRINTSGAKDLKSPRINTSGNKDLKSNHFNTSKKGVGGWGAPPPRSLSPDDSGGLTRRVLKCAVEISLRRIPWRAKVSQWQ
jgi:hypothetical protein